MREIVLPLESGAPARADGTPSCVRCRFADAGGFDVWVMGPRGQAHCLGSRADVGAPSRDFDVGYVVARTAWELRHREALGPERVQQLQRVDGMLGGAFAIAPEAVERALATLDDQGREVARAYQQTSAEVVQWLIRRACAINETHETRDAINETRTPCNPRGIPTATACVRVPSHATR